jgi:cytochrome c oxidase subunit 4
MEQHSEHSTHIIPSKIYYGVFFALIVLTVVTALVATVDLGWANTPVALLIASGKATIVTLFFMHVKYTHEKMTKTVILSVLFFLLILLFFSMADYSTRHLS